MKTTSLILAPITILTFLTGCVAVHKVHYKDATRADVSFESLKASNTFYDALLAKKFPSQGKDSRILLGQTAYTSETRDSANVVFNSAVAVADLNQDNIISDTEAHSFAATRGNPNSHPQRSTNDVSNVEGESRGSRRDAPTGGGDSAPH